MLDALQRAAPVGLAFFDAELRYVRVNAALARMNELPVEAHLGRRIDEVLPHLAPVVAPLLRRVLSSGETLEGIEVPERRPPDEGGLRLWLASYFPIGDPAAPAGVGVVAEEVTEQRRLLDARRSTEARERQVTRRLARLHTVASALAGAVSPAEVADVLVRQVAGAIGLDRAWVSLLGSDGQTLEVAATVGYPAEAVRRFRRLHVDDPLPGPDAVRDGNARWYGNTDELAAAYPALAGAYREDGNVAGAIVPIAGTTGPLGFIALAGPRPHRFTDGERRLVSTIARQCAQALERAAIYEREHATAEALSRSLLPARLPDVPGVLLAARYAPAPAIEASVGGDFYDAFAAGDGLWVLVVGDVCGKGPEAAALTALVRYTLRAEALHDSRPMHLLELLNAAILAQRNDERFCSVACARLDLRDPARPRIDVCTAGHPEAILLEPGGRARTIGVPGTLLGIVPDPRLGFVELAPPRGSALALYTDGLLEAYAPRRTLSPADLAAAAAGHAGDAGELVERLLARALRDGDGPPRDDIAVLAAKLTED